jgi:hypothetical protein
MEEKCSTGEKGAALAIRPRSVIYGQHDYYDGGSSSGKYSPCGTFIAGGKKCSERDYLWQTY